MNGTPYPDEIMVRGLRRLLRDVEIATTATTMGLQETAVGETELISKGFETLYRGYLVSELVEKCSYMEVAYLLIKGELPDEELLADFRSIMSDNSYVDPQLQDFIESMPLHVPAMDVMRSCISMLSHFDMDLDPFAEQGTPDLVVSQAMRLMAQLPTLLSFRFGRQYGRETPNLDQDLSYVANLFIAMTGELPTTTQEHALNRLLILHACNNFDGPTLAARTVSSCRSDFYSAALAAVSAVKGSEELGGVRQHLLAVQELSETDSIIEEVKALLTQGPLDGFIPEVEDRRGILLNDDCRELATTCEQKRLESTARGVEQMVYAASCRVPDLRWSSARLLEYLGLDNEGFSPLLAIARIPGWAGHCREQMRSSERVRPLAQYVGPPARSLNSIVER
jgi:citrate synthase